MKDKTKYLITGALSGLANGFFGSGGGLFLVPLLTRWTKMDEKKAFATSVSIILSLSVVSAAVYFVKGGLDFSSATPYLIGGAAGGAVSGMVFKKVSPVFLRKVFAILIIYGGVRAVLAL